jgi:hypothetical protein
MCGWKDTVDDTRRCHGTPSQTEPASTPEAIEDQQQSGGPLEKYQCMGRRPFRCTLPATDVHPDNHPVGAS